MSGRDARRRGSQERWLDIDRHLLARSRHSTGFRPHAERNAHSAGCVPRQPSDQVEQIVTIFNGMAVDIARSAQCC